MDDDVKNSTPDIVIPEERLGFGKKDPAQPDLFLVVVSSTEWSIKDDLSSKGHPIISSCLLIDNLLKCYVPIKSE